MFYVSLEINIAKKKYDIEKINELYGEKIENLYNSNVFANKIAEEVLGNKKDYRFIFEILKKRQVHIKTRSEIKQYFDVNSINSKYNNTIFAKEEKYFSLWSDNMAYILGYIATDGNINKGNTLSFGTSKQDEDILYKIKQELKYEGNITHYTAQLNEKKYETSCLSIHSKQIYNDLIKLGITENKSLTLNSFSTIVPEKYEIPFLLGVFDGDGSIGKICGNRCKNSIQFRLRYFSASYSFIEYIKNTMKKHGYKDAKIIENQGRKNLYYSLTYSTKDAIKFYKESYSFQTIYINRKKEKYDLLIKERIKYESEKKTHLKIKNT